MLVVEAYKRLQDAERVKIINFDHYSGSVWHEINGPNAEGIGSGQFNRSFDVRYEIVDIIDQIGEQAKPESSYGTKKSALETLRKIGKTIVLSGYDCLGSEVRKSFAYETCLEDTMYNILGTMTEDERIRVGQSADEKGALVDKVVSLSEEASGYGMFERLDAVINMMADGKATISDDANEEEGEDDENEDAGDENERESDGSEVEAP